MHLTKSWADLWLCVDWDDSKIIDVIHSFCWELDNEWLPDEDVSWVWIDAALFNRYFCAPVDESILLLLLVSSNSRWQLYFENVFWLSIISTFVGRVIEFIDSSDKLIYGSFFGVNNFLDDNNVELVDDPHQDIHNFLVLHLRRPEPPDIECPYLERLLDDVPEVSGVSGQAWWPPSLTPAIPGPPPGLLVLGGCLCLPWVFLTSETRRSQPHVTCVTDPLISSGQAPDPWLIMSPPCNMGHHHQVPANIP